MIDRINLVVIGDAGAGKTCLLKNIIFKDKLNKASTHRATCELELKEDEEKLKECMHNYCPTILITTVHQFDHQDGKLEIVFWDTSGSDKYKALRLFAYRKCDMILLCFPINSMRSYFKLMDKWKPELRENCPTTPLIAVATKQDLLPSLTYSSDMNEPEPTQEQRSSMAIVLRAVEYMECSSKNLDTIQTLIDVMIEKIISLKTLKKLLRVNTRKKLIHPTYYRLTPQQQCHII